MSNIIYLDKEREKRERTPKECEEIYDFAPNAVKALLDGDYSFLERIEYD